jgi:hypothetical protein
MPLDPSQRIQFGGGYVWSESVEENYVRFGQSTATHHFKCLWNDRISIIQNVFGGGGLNTGNAYVYNNAQPYPYAQYMYPSRARVRGIAGPMGLTTQGSPQPISATAGPTSYPTILGTNSSTPIVGFTYADVDLEYASQPYLEGQPGEWSIEFSMTELTLSNNTTGTSSSASGTAQSACVWKWAAGPNNGQVLDNSQFPSLPIPTVTLSYQQFNAAAIPFLTICSIIGLVNSQTIQIATGSVAGVQPTFGFAAGSLLFAGGRSVRRMNQLGNPAWDITYNFQFNPFGWNNVLNPGNGTFYKITNSAGNTPFLYDGTGNAGSAAAPFNSGGYTINNITNTFN